MYLVEYRMPSNRPFTNELFRTCCIRNKWRIFRPRERAGCWLLACLTCRSRAVHHRQVRVPGRCQSFHCHELSCSLIQFDTHSGLSKLILYHRDVKVHLHSVQVVESSLPYSPYSPSPPALYISITLTGSQQETFHTCKYESYL